MIFDALSRIIEYRAFNSEELRQRLDVFVQRGRLTLEQYQELIIKIADCESEDTIRRHMI